MVAAILNAAKFLPSSLVLKGLSKINPKFKNFFTQAASYGYDADRALEYLASKFKSPGETQFKDELDRGASQGTLRPDEAVARQGIQSAELPGKIARGIASFGGAALSGSRNGEEEQEAQPISYTTEHPSTFDEPNFGPTIVKHGKEMPAKFGSKLNVLSQRAQSAPPERSYNPLEGLQKYPALAKFIQKEASAGSDAMTIAAKAKKSKMLNPIVKKVETEADEPFESLLSRIVGERKPQANAKHVAVLNMVRQYKAAKAGK